MSRAGDWFARGAMHSGRRQPAEPASAPTTPTCRAAEVRRWQAAAEQQAEQAVELRVQAEAVRRRGGELEQALAAAQADKGAAEAAGQALLAQLRAVEASAAAVEGAAGERGRGQPVSGCKACCRTAAALPSINCEAASRCRRGRLPARPAGGGGGAAGSGTAGGRAAEARGGGRRRQASPCAGGGRVAALPLACKLLHGASNLVGLPSRCFLALQAERDRPSAAGR